MHIHASMLSIGLALAVIFQVYPIYRSAPLQSESSRFIQAPNLYASNDYPEAHRGSGRCQSAQCTTTY